LLLKQEGAPMFSVATRDPAAGITFADCADDR
jgi:hypothetical protein